MKTSTAASQPTTLAPSLALVYPLSVVAESLANTEATARRLMVQQGYAPQPPPSPQYAPLGQLVWPFES